MWQGCHRKAKKRKCDRQMPCLCAKEVALRTSVPLSVEYSLRGRPTFLSFCPPAKGIRISLSQLKEAPQKPQVRFPKEVKNPWMFSTQLSSGKSKRRGRKEHSGMDRKASMMSRMEVNPNRQQIIPRRGDFTGAFQRRLKSWQFAFWDCFHQNIRDC